MIKSEILWTENVELRIDLDHGDPTPRPVYGPELAPLMRAHGEERSVKVEVKDEEISRVCLGSELESSNHPPQGLHQRSRDDNLKKKISCHHSSNSECSSLHSNSNDHWKQKPVDTAKYFGFSARHEFYQRHKFLLEHKNIFQHDADEMKERIRFDHQKPNQQHQPSAIEYPFAPQRPIVESEEKELSSLPSSSSISGLFSDLSFASSIPPALDSISTFNASQVKHDPGPLTSPRSKFLTGCVKNKVNPPASLILRKKLSRSLQLQHYGFGDQYGPVYALALEDMPLIDTINIEDNNLTDKGLYPIIRAIISLSTVTDLNLSNNIVDGDTARAMSDYLSSPSCCIKRLILQRADIDDEEGTAFLSALKHNSTLVELDISHNLIGKSENMNTVFPELITGGEALADLLSSNSCALTTLRLPWNLIRLDGAVALSSSLQHNSHILFLDISYNSIGEAGGEALGASLLTNHTLQTLLIQNNNLTSSACFAICVGIEENFSLREVNLDGNPIGELGAKILTQLPIVCGERVKVSAARCNLSMKYPKDVLFNMESPSALYSLHLNDHFERAVCLKLLRLVAAHPTFEFNQVIYHPPSPSLSSPSPLPPKGGSSSQTKTRPSSAPSGRTSAGVAAAPAAGASRGVGLGSKNRQKKMLPSRPRVIHLKQGISSLHADSLDDVKRILIEKLQRLQQAARNSEEVISLFHSFDSDRSGSLDQQELQQLLHSIGLDVPSDVLESAIEKFDVDGIGTLELPEFMDFLKSQDEEATARIQEMTELPVMIEATPGGATSGPRGGQTGGSTSVSGRRYIPPLSGVIEMSVGDTYTNKKSQKIISALDHQYVMDLVSRGTESIAKTLIYSIQNSRLRLREALSIFHAINEEIYDKAEIAMKILPRVADPSDARQFLLQAFRYDKTLWKRLETLMGTALKVCIGLFNGFYSLDLSLLYDRVCLAKLLEQSQAKCMERMAKGKALFAKPGPGTGAGAGATGTGIVTGDVSQWGDWSSFRNAYLDGKPTLIVPEMFNPMPCHGKIHFDFSGGSKYVYGESITNDSRCVNLLLNLQLIPPEQGAAGAAEAHQKLREMREMTRRDLAGDGQYEPFVDRLKAEAIQLSMLKFYHELPSRPEQLEQGYKYAVGGLATPYPVPRGAGAGRERAEISLNGSHSGSGGREEVEFVQKMTSGNRYEATVLRALGPVGAAVVKQNAAHAGGTPTSGSGSAFGSGTDRDRLETSRGVVGGGPQVPPLATIAEDGGNSERAVGGGKKTSSSRDNSGSGERMAKVSEEGSSSAKRAGDQSLLTQPGDREAAAVAVLKKNNPLLAQRKSSPKNIESFVSAAASSAASSASSAGSRRPSTAPKPLNRIGFFDQESGEKSSGALGNLAKSPLVTHRRPAAGGTAVAPPSTSASAAVTFGPSEHSAEITEEAEEPPQETQTVVAAAMATTTVTASGTATRISRPISRSQSISMATSSPLSTPSPSPSSSAPFSLKKLGKAQSTSNLRVLTSAPLLPLTSSPSASSSSSVPASSTSVSSAPSVSGFSTRVTPTAHSTPSQLKKLESLASFDEEPNEEDNNRSRHSAGVAVSGRTGSGDTSNPKVLLPQNTDEYMQGYGHGLASLASQASKAMKVVDALCDVLSRVWILCRHLALICQCFQDSGGGLALRTLHFGTYRVELIISLYSRLADVNNFDVVLKVLTPAEIACVYCRLGVLNLFNPLKPEGFVCLNLARREERVIAKMLAVLSVYEPGDNWLEKSFRWGYDKDEIPGWELTKLWLTEEGMLQKGFLVVNYYSGDGKHLRGCCPNVPFRKSLLHLVSLEESDFIHDLNNKLSLVTDSSPIHSSNEGDKVAKAHIDLWMQLLAPPESSSALIAQGSSDNGMSVMKVFQQLKINPAAYRDPVRDIFAQAIAPPRATAKRKTTMRQQRRTVRATIATAKGGGKDTAAAKP